MVPPKKDAFADLFQSANARSPSSSLNNLSLLERQKRKQTNNLGLLSADNWCNIDILSSSNPSSSIASGTESSRSSTPQNHDNTLIDDPFSIFGNGTTISKNNENSGNYKKPTDIAVRNLASSPAAGEKPISRHSNQTAPLLDDEFTDAFLPEPPQPKPDNESIDQYRTTGFTMSANNSNQSINSLDKKDTVLAELVDIGFSIDISNQAIREVGPDLQLCVNYIMNGRDNTAPKRSAANRPNQNVEQDISSKINDLSTDFFNKASVFLNKSKQTVLKNIEHFQQGQSSHSDPSLPNWMRSQHKYKSEAIERKSNGEKYEDYGSDEENINQEAVNEFIKLQKQKDKERAKSRYENLKGLARNKINFSNPSDKKKPDLPKRPSSQPTFSSIVESNIPSPQKVPSPSISGSQQMSSPSNQVSIQEVNLLGLNQPLSRAEKFKASSTNDEVYMSSSRRRQKSNRITVSTPLNQFQQSDYDTSKARASALFRNGDYDNSLNFYLKCLNSLPNNHELRVLINSNISLNFIKLGNYKQAKEYCDVGLKLINKEDLNNSEIIVNDKAIKYWYTKLLSRKAESLEMLELFPESLNCYLELIKLGVNDKKIMEGKRRVNNIVNPPAKKIPAKKTATRPSSTSKPSSKPKNENLHKLQQQNAQLKNEEELKFQLHDKIQEKLLQWSNGKEDNLRSLLISLSTVLPERLGFPFITDKKLTLNDLMLPKKVKINYMKVISSIHPDKLNNLELEDKMICQGVFIILNKSWDIFKEQNGMS